MKVGSLFAGIGGFDLGFERAGFEVAWCAEWDRNAQAVLRTRFPSATIYGDIREIDLDALKPVDVICGGFPCQDLSVAGKRAGLSGARSGLFHDAMRLVRRLNPRVLILENVPGLLSSNNGLDFATVLREVGEGWDCAEVAWRVLDSQYFRVAQRRRRVFVVAGSRTGCAEQILALAEGGGGDPPTRGAPRQEAASDASRCPRADGARWWDGGDCAASLTTRCHDQSMPDKSNFAAVVAFTGTSHAQYAEGVRTLRANGGDLGGGSETLAVAFHPTQDPISSTDGSTHALGCGNRQGCATVAVAVGGSVSHALTGEGHDAGEDGTGRVTPIVAQGIDLYNHTETGDVAATVTSASGGTNTSGPKVLSFAQNQMGEVRISPISSTIGTTGNASARTTGKIQMGMTVRRLTPTECERLQGFPDGWTQIGTNKPTADSHRYKQLGNAVTVNVAEWIARRVAAWMRAQDSR